MIICAHPIADNLPIKTLVARRLHYVYMCTYEESESIYAILFKGEHLTPLDYCSGENADLAELLRSFGSLSGETEQRAAAEKERAALIDTESMMIQEQEKDKKDDGVLN